MASANFVGPPNFANTSSNVSIRHEIHNVLFAVKTKRIAEYATKRIMEEPCDRLEKARRNAGFEQAVEAARAFGWQESTYVSHENGTRGIRPEVAERYARAFRVRPEWLLYGRHDVEERTSPETDGATIVKVVGRVGAGAEILPEIEQLPPEGLFQIEIPFPVPENTLAFEVSGDSMWPRYDSGDVVLCWKDGTNADEIVGWEAAVMTSDGKRYLKRVLRGSKARQFDLESFNAPVIRNVKLTWVSKVQFVVRAGEWKHLGRTIQRRISKKMTES